MVNKTNEPTDNEEHVKGLIRLSIKRTRSLFKNEYENPPLDDENRLFFK